MRLALATLMLLASGLPAGAEPLSEYRWEKRPIVVFAPDRLDPRRVEQLDRFEGARSMLEERENVVIVDTEQTSGLRQHFEPDPFTVILVGKDGTEKLRRTQPVSVEVLTELVDSMPMRRREMRAPNPG